jgi:hypothetical protein
VVYCIQIIKQSIDCLNYTGNFSQKQYLSNLNEQRIEKKQKWDIILVKKITIGIWMKDQGQA